MSETEVILHHGDCLEVMQSLQSASVALFFSDLPYGVTVGDWDKHIDLSLLWARFRQLARHPAKYCFTATQPFATRLIISNLPAFCYDLVWQKNRMSGYLSAKKAPLRKHENILVFGKGGTFNPQMTTTEKPIVVVSAGKKPSVSKTTGTRCVNKVIGQTRYPTSILPFDREDKRNGQGHPTQKPVALLEWLIKTYTNDGDTILDPCAGSGTTALAAINVGNRKVICVEKDKNYFEVMSKRVAEHRTKSSQQVAQPLGHAIDAKPSNDGLDI